MFYGLIKILKTFFRARPRYVSLSLTVSRPGSRDPLVGPRRRQPATRPRPSPLLQQPRRPTPTQPLAVAAGHRDCSCKLESLGRTAWKTQESLSRLHFSLDSSRLPQIEHASDLDLTLQLLLTHARI